MEGAKRWNNVTVEIKEIVIDENSETDEIGEMVW